MERKRKRTISRDIKTENTEEIGNFPDPLRPDPSAVREFTNSVSSPTDSPISVSIPGTASGNGIGGNLATQVAQHLAGMHGGGIGMGNPGFGQPAGSNQFQPVPDSVYQNIAHQFQLSQQIMGHQGTNSIAAWNHVNQSQMPNHFLPSQPVQPSGSGSTPEIPDHLMQHRRVSQPQHPVNNSSASQLSPSNHNLLFNDNLRSDPEPRQLQSSRLSGSTIGSATARSARGLIANTINDSGKRFIKIESLRPLYVFLIILYFILYKNFLIKLLLKKAQPRCQFPQFPLPRQ